MEKFFATLQIIFACIVAGSISTVTLYHTFKGNMNVFPGVLMFAACAVAFYMFLLSWKELKQAYSK